MHRFFLPGVPLHPGAAVDLLSLSTQIVRVLRLHPGDRILVLDDRGSEAVVELATVQRRQLTGIVIEQCAAPSEARLHLTLYACILKSDKFEWLLQKGTELGVAEFVPVISARTVARDISGNKRARLETILREAAEQCGRGRLPLLHEPIPLAQAIRCDARLRLLPWEDAHGSPSLVDALRAARTIPTRAALLIGPEGGFMAGEVMQARERGWQPVTLGPRILRAETAAVAAAAVIMAEAGELG